MAIINETKKYLHMLVKILVFILVLCGLKLIESFFEVRRMPEAYLISYLVFSYFILGRLFSERKEKLLILVYILLEAFMGYYIIEKNIKQIILYIVVFIILSVIMIIVYEFFNRDVKKREKNKLLIFLIPCYLIFIKFIFLITYVYLHIDEYNFFALWFL